MYSSTLYYILWEYSVLLLYPYSNALLSLHQSSLFCSKRYIHRCVNLREWETLESSAVNSTCISQLFLPRFNDLHGTLDGKNVKTAGWLYQNSVLQVKLGSCTYELTAAITACKILSLTKPEKSVQCKQEVVF